MYPNVMRSLVLFLSLLTPISAHAQNDVSLWLTNPTAPPSFNSRRLQYPSPKLPATNQIIDVDPAKTYQTIDGFGFALTGGSAQLIQHMDPDARAALLHELFATDANNIGVSYLRLPSAPPT